MPDDNLTSSPEIGRSLTVRGIKVNYHDRGNGPPVLLIHGSGPGVTAWANWRLTIPVLEEQCRVIAPDMAGFGYTDSPHEVTCSSVDWSNQLLGLLDAIDIETVSIVGNSFGGSIALEFAKRNPHRCDKLVLMGAVGTPFHITAGLESVWGYTPSHENMRELLKVFVANEDLVSEDLVEMRYRASIRPGVQERFARLFPAPRQRWVDALSQTPADLATIKQPILLIHGKQDKVIPFAASESLSTLLPNASLLPIDQCGHWVQIEQAEVFSQALLDFLTQSDDAGAKQ